MKSKIIILSTLLLSSLSLPVFADSFYLNLNQPGVQIGVNTGQSLPAPGYWMFEGQRYYGPPVPPRNPHDASAWKRYKHMQKAYDKHIKKHHKLNKKYSPKRAVSPVGKGGPKHHGHKH